MSGQRMCPFYGRNMEQCDVGFGYISPYHVEVMVRHCTSHYEDCSKYQELAMRDGDGDEAGIAQCSTECRPTAPPSGGLLLPLPLDRETLTTVHHVLRTPLTSIRSFTEILLSYPIDDPEAQRRFLGIIHDETERLAHALDILFGKTAPDVDEAESNPLNTYRRSPHNEHPQTSKTNSH